MTNLLYVVGKYIMSTDDGLVWGLQGIFEEEVDAVNGCIESTYFVGPMPKNTLVPDEPIEWPGVYYPKLESKKEVDYNRYSSKEKKKEDG